MKPIQSPRNVGTDLLIESTEGFRGLKNWGEPADALTLGRDLHWFSGGEEDWERQANELLGAAYRALGRDGLAAVADAHHRHRDLPNVTILEGQ